MFTRCMICKEESIETMEKIHCNQGKLNENYGRIAETLGKPINTMENPVKPWKNRWTVQMANFNSKIQQSTGFCSKL